MKEVYRAKLFKHGLRCMKCNRTFVEGEEYELRPLPDPEWAEIVCGACA